MNLLIIQTETKSSRRRAKTMADIYQGYNTPTTPKLPFFSFGRKELAEEEEASAKRGMPRTPPIHPLASIPFQWEEAPGKPRPSSSISKPNSAARFCLQLPPRLLNQHLASKLTNFPPPSPTTVLDGPYNIMPRSLSQSSSLVGKPALSFHHRHASENLGKSTLVTKKEIVRGRLLFRSIRWKWPGKSKESVPAVWEDPSSTTVVGSDDHGVNDGAAATEVKITRIRRRSSFLTFSSTTSHLWTGIRENIKMVVPWGRGQEKSRRVRQ